MAIEKAMEKDMQLDPKGLEAARTATEAVSMVHAEATVRAYLEAAPSPSPAPGVVEQNAETHLSNLLTRIHRDGGHYEAEHGTDKAREDAGRIIAELYASTPANPAQVTDADSDLLSQCYIAMRDAMSVIDVNEGPGLKHSKILNALADARVKIERRTERQPVAAISVAAKELYGPFGWLNGCRGLSEDSWNLESDPLENSDEYFAVPLYALTDPFKEVGLSTPPLTAVIGAGGQAVDQGLRDAAKAMGAEVARNVPMVGTGEIMQEANRLWEAGIRDGTPDAAIPIARALMARDKRAADRIEALEVWKAEAMEVLRRHRANTVPVMKALMATGSRADLILADDVHRADDAARRLVEKEDGRG